MGAHNFFHPEYTVCGQSMTQSQFVRLQQPLEKKELSDALVVAVHHSVTGNYKCTTLHVNCSSQRLYATEYSLNRITTVVLVTHNMR